MNFSVIFGVFLYWMHLQPSISTYIFVTHVHVIHVETQQLCLIEFMHRRFCYLLWNHINVCYSWLVFVSVTQITNFCVCLMKCCSVTFVTEICVNIVRRVLYECGVCIWPPSMYVYCINNPINLIWSKDSPYSSNHG